MAHASIWATLGGVQCRRRPKPGSGAICAATSTTAASALRALGAADRFADRVDGTRATGHYWMVDAGTHDDLSGRLRGLLIDVEDRLPPKTREFVGDLIDASEFGIALETMAEMLCEYDQPVTSSERADFMQLARRMAMDDRVERNLALCPERP